MTNAANGVQNIDELKDLLRPHAHTPSANAFRSEIGASFGAMQASLAVDLEDLSTDPARFREMLERFPSQTADRIRQCAGTGRFQEAAKGLLEDCGYNMDMAVSQDVDAIQSLADDIKSDLNREGAVPQNTRSIGGHSFGEVELSAQTAPVGTKLGPEDNSYTVIYENGRAEVDGQLTSENVYNGSMISYLEMSKNDAPLSSDTTITDADHIILSHLTYMSKESNDLDFKMDSLKDGSNPIGDPDKPVTVGEYAGKLRDQLSEELAEARRRAKDSSANEKDIAFYESEVKRLEYDVAYLDGLCENKRYNTLKITGNEANWSHGISDHMMVIEYADGKGAYFAFEGTDGTFGGWETDVAYAYETDNEYEIWSRETFLKYAGRYEYIDMGGHSRGGHNAAYVYLTVDDYHAAKIRNVYSLDGPGFNGEFLDKYEMQIAMREGRITNVRPYNSAVGQFLYDVGNEPVYIEINGGIAVFLSHDDRYWQIGDDGRVVSEYNTTGWDKALRQYIKDVSIEADKNLNKEEFAVFADALFSFTRDYRYDQFGSNIAFDQFVPNLVNEIKHLDFENTLEVLGTLAVLLDSGVLTAALPPEVQSCMIALEAAAAVLFPQFYIPFKVFTIKVQLVIKVVAIVFKIYAKIKEEMRRRERENYLRSNPVIRVNVDSLFTAAAALKSAANYMRDAEDNYSRLYKHVEINLFDLLGTLISVNKLANILVADIVSVRGNYQGYWLTKLGNAVGRCAELWQSAELAISDTTGSSLRSKQIYVAPDSLIQRAQGMQDAAEDYLDAYNDVNRAVQQLHSQKAISAENYKVYSQNTDEIAQSLQGFTESLTKYSDLLKNIAETYQKVQADSVTNFQEA